ncbi:MAG: glycosyltransferase family 2 protein [Bryobacteraceae bacterium]|nr:glycosyltransferase family 2 protein [Bryobacteraceae bacterium]
MTGAPDIAIVIVGFSSRAYTENCLRSLERADLGSWTTEVIYVDNASTDGSVEMVHRLFPFVRTIANQRNVGFCAACNQGVGISRARFIYLLNNDTVLEASSIRPLADFLDANSHAAAVGNRLLNPDGTDQWSGRRFPGWLNSMLGRRTPFPRFFAESAVVRHYLYKDEMRAGAPFEVDWIPGSCTLVRRDVYLQAGSLSESMHYWSDALFCARIRKLGWSTFIIPAAPLVHFEGNGTGQKNRALREWLIRDFHQGAYRFYCEYYELERWNPIRWVARIGLGVRAWLLINAGLFSAAGTRSKSTTGGHSN